MIKTLSNLPLPLVVAGAAGLARAALVINCRARGIGYTRVMINTVGWNAVVPQVTKCCPAAADGKQSAEYTEL